MNFDELLATAKDRCQPPNYSALAAALKVEPSAVSNWRHGRAHPDAVSCAKLAEMTGQPLAKVLGLIGERRAISKEEKAVWRRLASAAAILLAVALPYRAQATAPISERAPLYTLCELLRRHWPRRLHLRMA